MRSSPGRARSVIVVGAGPAGAAMAARMAGLGHRTLLLDRSDFPRRKPCGDCVNPAALAALHRLGAAERVLDLPHSLLNGWRIRPGWREPFEGSFPEGRLGLGIAREDFDATLLEHAAAAGAEARLEHRVVDVLRHGERVVGVRATHRGGTLDLHADLVVGADGIRSIVSRRLGLLRRGPKLRKVALTARVRGLAEGDGRGELHALPWGCVGVAPIGRGVTNVTAVVTGGHIEELSGRKREFFDSMLAGIPALAAARLEGRVLATGPFDLPVRSAVRDGAMLVGDAAGYYDPFTGQGIYRALRGAELAAEAAHEALLRGDATAAALRSYEEARRREFGPGERLQHVIEAVVSRPLLISAAAAVLRRRAALADALIAVTGDLEPVGSLARPRLFVR